MKDAIIRAEALRFSYTSAEGVAPVVLDGVDLSIQEGTFVAVLATTAAANPPSPST